MNQIIKIAEYDNNYPSIFESEKERISKSINSIEIEHIGSTAIEGTPGKGIIDILIAIPNLNSHKEVKEKLKKLGYIYKESAGNPGRLFFSDKDLSSPDVKFHIHVVEKDSKECKEPIIFRNYLREHSRAKEAYITLKKKLALNVEGPRDYLESKTPFVNKILKKAK